MKHSHVMGSTRSKKAINHTRQVQEVKPVQSLRYTLDINKLTATKSEQDIQSPRRTLVVMDWDDTLFPTTLAEKVLSRSSEQSPRTFLLVTTSELKELRVFSQSLYKLLMDLIGCHSSSNLKIVTTSSIGWPRHSLMNFKNIGYFGAIYRLLFEEQDVEVIHPAPSCLPFKSRSDVIRFKTLAFSHLYLEHQHKIHSMVSIGDDLCEFIAVKSAFDHTMKGKMQYLQRIKLQSKPTLKVMIDQINLLDALVVEDLFRTFPSRNRPFDICYDFNEKRWNPHSVGVV